MIVKLEEVCKRIYAGGDVPKDRYSEEKTEDYKVPIFANAEKDEGLYGYTDEAREKELSITVAARGTIGYTAIRREPFLPVVRLITVVPDLEKVSERYLFYALKKCKPQSSGTSIPQLTVPDIKKNTINLLDIAEQESIANRLDKLNGIIKLRKEVISKLDELIRARFVEMFGDPEINPYGYSKAHMGDYITLLTDFSSNGSYKTLDSGVTMYDKPNYAWMVRTTDLETEDMTSIKYIDESAYELLEKSKLFGGEIIMNKIGSAGNVYLMPEISMPASLGRNAFMFRYDDRINTKYLFQLLKSEYGQREIKQYVRGAVTQTITKNDVRAVIIVVPPIELQNKYVDFIDQVNKSKFEVQKALDKAQLLFDSLMQKYFG
jgi:hypothetical protein